MLSDRLIVNELSRFDLTDESVVVCMLSSIDCYAATPQDNGQRLVDARSSKQLVGRELFKHYHFKLQGGRGDFGDNFNDFSPVEILALRHAALLPSSPPFLVAS